MVDLPEPFSPTSMVTAGWSLSFGRSRTAGMVKGNASKSISASRRKPTPWKKPSRSSFGGLCLMAGAMLPAGMILAITTRSTYRGRFEPGRDVAFRLGALGSVERAAPYVDCCVRLFPGSG